MKCPAVQESENGEEVPIGMDTRVHYYSAVEDDVAPKVFVNPSAKKVPAKPTAVLVAQLALLTESIPVLTQQMEKLRADQARLEGVGTRGQDVQKPPHQMDFPQPTSPSLADMAGFAKAVGAPPRTKTATPLRQLARPLFPEDEPTAQPEQEGFQVPQHVPPGDQSGGSATHKL